MASDIIRALLELLKLAPRYIAAAGQPGAPETLANKIRTGGKGSWGDIPMPPNATVTADDSRILSNWVLSLK